MPARKKGGSSFTLRDLRLGYTESGERLRLGSPLTQGELAHRCSVTQQQISAVEAGTSKGSPVLLWRISQALSVDHDAVLSASRETMRRAEKNVAPPRKTRNA